jgi:ATP-dependent RNA helicase SUPV3L1/SUV3
VIIDAEGEVTVGSYAIGKLQGFAFEVDPAAKHADRKMLLAAAERRLGGEYEKRAAALVADTDDHFSLRGDPALPPAILWRGHEVARLVAGKNLLSPRVQLDRRIDRVSERGRTAVITRLKAGWPRRSSGCWRRCAGPAWRVTTLRPHRSCAPCWRCWSTTAASSRARRWPGRWRGWSAMRGGRWPGSASGSARWTCSCPWC